MFKIELLDHAIHVNVNEVQSRRGAPMAQQPRLDIFGRQRLPQQRVVDQIDLADGKVVRRRPVCLHLPELFRIERIALGRSRFCHLFVTLPNLFLRRAGFAQSWHAARDTRCAVLLWMSLLFTGCGRYADFTLPVLAAARPLDITAQLAPEPVLRRNGVRDVLNPSVVFQAGIYSNFYSEFDGTTWHTALADLE